MERKVQEKGKEQKSTLLCKYKVKVGEKVKEKDGKRKGIKK